MSSGLASYLEELRLGLAPPAEVEPDVDPRDLGLEEADTARFRCGRTACPRDLAPRQATIQTLLCCRVLLLDSARHAYCHRSTQHCCREEEDLRAGAVLKGSVEPGEGSERPQEGDLVRGTGDPGCQQLSVGTADARPCVTCALWPFLATHHYLCPALPPAAPPRSSSTTA